MIEVGILKTWDSAAYKAGVQLAGSLTAYFDEVNVARNIASSAMVVGNYVLVAMPEDNPKDGCVIAAWPGGSDAHHARHELGGADQVEVKDLIYLYQTGEYYKQWDSVTGWTENNTGGSNDPRGTFLYMQTGAVANNIVNIYMTPGYFWIGRWTRWAAEISIRYNHATNNQITAYFGLAEAPTDPGSNYHMAFFIDNANLKASTRGPGGTQVTDTGIDP
ncbi:MAG: hypothetical protein U9R04_05665, partial [Chloroflexota bacterium]|nr:hypothetical protein [Chloroflexota bacterium]